MFSLTYKKIRSQKELVKILSQKSYLKKKIVFTNGCFDLLHLGHVRYLEKAKSLGDLLIVGLNTDESVTLLKGPTRPITPLRDRLAVLAALQAVDFVTWFSEETPLNLIKLIHPIVLVKGADWPASKIAGAKEVKRWGGRIKRIPYVKGKSTTSLVQTIQRLREPQGSTQNKNKNTQ